MPIVAYVVAIAVAVLRVTGRWKPAVPAAFRGAFAIGGAALGLVIVNAERNLGPANPPGAGVSPSVITLLLVGGGAVYMLGLAIQQRFVQLGYALRVVGLIGLVIFFAFPSALVLLLPLAVLLLTDELMSFSPRDRRPAPIVERR